MAVYKNLSPSSSLTAVEFTPVSDGNFSFFYVSAPQNKEALKQWLTSKEIGQEVIAESKVGGQPVIIMHGSKTKEEMLKLLEARGGKLQFQPPLAKGMDPWKLISMLAVPGQSMQLASSFMKKGGKLDWGLFAFAGSNLLGHVISWVYGSQKSDDVHRLQFIKKEVNNGLAEYLPDGRQLPGVQEDRSARHDEPAVAPGLGKKLNLFLKENSVTFGEIFLRYFGAFALAFPANRWRAGLSKLKGGSLQEAYHAAKNVSTGNAAANITHYAGLGSLFGKTIALFSKVPDPYDPQPKTGIDDFREKWVFRIGGNIEAVAFGAMAYDAYTDPKNKIMLGGKEYKNYLSTAGASMFSARYLVRNFAKYGEKELDTDEMYAHVVDGLAAMPHDKLPALIADIAADIKDHFKQEHLEYGAVYTRLLNDLYRYHHIALDNLGAEAEKNSVTMQQRLKPVDPAPEESPTARRTLVHRPPAPLAARLPARTGSYADAALAAGDTAYGVGA